MCLNLSKEGGNGLIAFVCQYGFVIRLNGRKLKHTMNLFRCTGISISMIFPCWELFLTQPMPIRPPWLRGIFSEHPAPKLL